MDSLKQLTDAFYALKEQGWREAMYCPRDSHWVQFIEAGSSGVHVGYRNDSGYWITTDNDTYPSSPILYKEKSTEQEAIAKINETFKRLLEFGYTLEVRPSKSGKSVVLDLGFVFLALGVFKTTSNSLLNTFTSALSDLYSLGWKKATMCPKDEQKRQFFYLGFDRIKEGYRAKEGDYYLEDIGSSIPPTLYREKA